MTETLVDTRPHHGGSSNEYQQHHDEQATTSASANGPGLLEATHHSNIGNTHRSVAAKLRPDVNPASGDGADVGTVMNKAKKAAQSIWVLVHAQNCRIGGDRCPHKGCTEAKRVLLHIKMCSSGNNSCGTCPTNYNGCQQSRKLLAHNQKCREIRAKQAGMGRRTNSKNAHVCLVCSLVARHARNVLEGTSSRKLNAKKQVIATFTLTEPGPDVISNTNGFMPPPPPRQRMGSSLPIPSIMSGSDSSSDDGLPFESPPTKRNQLMLFSEVAAAAASPTTTNPSGLGKSLDSSKSPFLAFAASALQNLKKASPTGSDDEEIIQHQPKYSPTRRSRAESYDERAHKMASPNNSRYQHRRHAHDGSDPTLELDLNGEQVFDGAEEVIVRRSRSASLGVLASACSVSRNGTCDTIVEEASLVREEEVFAMDEDERL